MALLAHCAAQSCEKQRGLLSLSIAQRGCWCSRAAVRWREGLDLFTKILTRQAFAAREGEAAAGRNWNAAAASSGDGEI